MPAFKDLKKRAVWIERISKSKKGKRCSPETEFKKGHKTWNIGKRPTEEAINKQREKTLGRHLSPMTEFKKGCVPWNVGTKGKGIMKPNKTSFKKGDVSYWKGKKLTKEHVKKILTRRIPSSLEEKFQGIIDKYNLPYEFVGDGSFFVEQYNPDFINIDGQKIAIEVYANFYKLRNHQNIDKWKEERAKIFKKYGWTIIYFNEIQVNENYVLPTLGGN